MEIHTNSHNTLTENVKSCIQDASQKYVARKDHVFFIKNELEKRYVLDRCCQHQNKSSMIEVFSSEDIFEDDLLESKIFFKEEEIKKSKGRLFSDESITIIFDFTKINPYQIPGLNDLLDSPVHFQGDTLHPSVQRIFFIHKEQLTSCFKSLSPDFWNRVRKILFLNNYSMDHLMHDMRKFSIEMQAHYLSNRELVYSKCCVFKEKKKGNIVDTKIKTIDFKKLGFTWQFSLKGGISLSEKGIIEFHHSALATLSKGDSVILHDAPWENEQFINSLATIIRYNGYRSNGKWISLPEDIQFTKTQTDFDEIKDLKKSLIHSQDSMPILLDQSSVILLNRELFDEVLKNTIQIEDDHYYSINPIERLLQDCTTILITNDLTEQQWLYLLKEVGKQSKKINILFDKKHVYQWNINENIKSCFYKNEEEVLNILAEKNDIYHITSSDQWNELWYKTHFTSYKNRLLKQEKTPLLKALMEGKNIVLYGLDNNPSLISHFESLLMNPSYLFIQGKKIKLPNINLTFLWKEESILDVLHQSYLWSKLCSSMITIGKKERKDKKSLKFKKIFNIIQRVQKDHHRDFSNWMDRDFKNMFYKQVLFEKKQDKSKIILPFHQRRALYTLFVKKNRDNENIVGYLKSHIRCLYPDRENKKANKKALKLWLEEHKKVNKKILKDNFWSLVRHCPIGKFKLHDEYDEIDNQSINMLSYYLLGSVSVEERENLAMKLGVSSDYFAKDNQYYDNNIRKNLYNALFIAGIENRRSNEAISLQLKKIEKKIYNIFSKTDDEKEIILKINQELQEVFESEILNNDFKELSLMLFQKRKDHRLNYLCRLKKLANRMELHPLIFLQGSTGTGKSYIAQAVYDELQKKAQWKKMPPPLLLNLGPETTREFLYGSEALIDSIDGDKKSQWEEGVIIQWALSDNPPLLILDEANLVKESILAPLAGLALDRPQLCIYGRKYELTQKHRVILTGNSHHYSGRHMDSTLQKKLITFYYRPLPKEILAQCIIEKNLPLRFSMEEKKYIKNIILFLYDQFSQILPVISPRDLYQVLSSIHYILSYYEEDKISKEQIHFLLWISFEENFFPHIKNNDYISALKTWYEIHYKTDCSIDIGNKEEFQKFLISFQSSLDHNIICETQSVKNLIYIYWSFLEKQKKSNFAKKGLIIEGPSGWGKDAIFKAVFYHWKQKYTEQELLIINANIYRWPEQVQQIKKAIRNGQKILISEINILSSADIEGLFNNILISSHHNGFALIATINPSSFKSREELSFSLKNRCQYINFSPLTEQDVFHILKYHCKNIDLCDFFAKRISFLSKKLQEKNSSVQIDRSNLIDCIYLAQKEEQEKWKDIFQKCCFLELESLSLNIEEFETIFQEKIISKSKDYLKRQQKLLCLINKNSNKPVIVKLLPQDIAPKWCVLTSTLILPDNECEDELQKLAHDVLNYNEESLVSSNVKKYYNVTEKISYSLVQYFKSDEFSESDYRLNIIEIDSNLKEKNIDCLEGGLEFLYPLTSSKYIIKSRTHQIGAAALELQKSKWTVIPGISSKDELVFLNCQEKVELEIVQGKITGQILIREIASDKKHYNLREVHIEFIIKPNKELLSFSSDDIKNMEVDRISCDQNLSEYLDEEVFSYGALTFLGCYELQQIKKIPHIFLRLEKLAQWCKTFKTTYNVCGDGLEYLVNVIKSKQGSCLQRTYVYKIISQYFGVRTRIIDNILHRYIEVSLNKGKIWKKIDLGGGELDSHSIKKLKPDYRILDCNSNKQEIPVFIGNKSEFENEIFSCMNMQLSQEQRENSWKTIEDIVLSFTQDNKKFLTVFITHIKSIFTSKLPVLNLVIKFFSLLEERCKHDSKEIISYRNYSIVIIAKIHELWKINSITNDNYNDFIERFIFFITDDRIFSTYLFTNLFNEIINSNFCREQKLLEKYWKKQYGLLRNKLTAQFTGSKKIELKKSRFQGLSQTLTHELMKEKNESYWTDCGFNGEFNSNRYIEGKPAFQIKKTADVQRDVYLPLFFGCKANLLHYLVEYYLEQIEQGNIKSSIKDKMKEMPIEKIQELFCELIEDFILYFLEKVYPTLNFMVIIKRDCPLEVKTGIYHKFNSIHDKKAIEILCTKRHRFNSQYMNLGYLSFEIIKEIIGDPSALFITEDFFKLCCEEYIETLNWNLITEIYPSIFTFEV